MTSTTLSRNPVRTSLSFTNGLDSSPFGITDAPSKPFGYQFANWTTRPADPEDEILGSYDPDSQTWVSPLGVPTMGIPTWTRTRGSKCGDCVQDDACQ